MAEVGILGTAALGLVFLRFFKSVWRSKDPFVVAIGCGVVALLINAVFIDIFEASKVAIVSWTLMGLAQKKAELND